MARNASCMFARQRYEMKRSEIKRGTKPIKRTGFKKPAKKKKVIPKAKRIKLIGARTWSLMSKYVRLRDKGKCITCGIVKPIGEMQAGHFKHASNLNRVSFDYRNINCQCARCNMYHSGMLDVYAQRLGDMFGYEVLDDLSIIRNEPHKLDEAYYERRIEELKGLIAELEGG